jgi:hypothetical protein
MHRVAIGEDMMRRLPIAVLVGVAKARHPQCRSIGQ